MNIVQLSAAIRSSDPDLVTGFFGTRSQDASLHNAVESLNSPLHFALVSTILLLQNVAENQILLLYVYTAES